MSSIKKIFLQVASNKVTQPSYIFNNNLLEKKKKKCKKKCKKNKKKCKKNKKK